MNCAPEIKNKINLDKSEFNRYKRKSVSVYKNDFFDRAHFSGLCFLLSHRVPRSASSIHIDMADLGRQLHKEQKREKRMSVSSSLFFVLFSSIRDRPLRYRLQAMSIRPISEHDKTNLSEMLIHRDSDARSSCQRCFFSEHRCKIYSILRMIDSI